MTKTSGQLSLNDSLFRRIKADILSGVLVPGQLISERQLEDRFRRSRTPIRHALARLNEQDLLTVHPRRGYVVSTLNIADVAEVFYMRTLLEGAAAALAATHVTERELALLERLAGKSYRPGDTASHARFVKSNRTFHLTIARASRNGRLEKAIEGLLDDMQRVITTTVALSSQMDAMQRDHRRITYALRRREPDSAREAVEAHMHSSRVRIGEALHMPGTRS